MKSSMILTVVLFFGIQITSAFATVKCQDIESNSNYFLISNSSFSSSAGWKVIFGRTGGYDRPVLYQNTFRWGAGALMRYPNYSAVEYSANFEYFGQTEGPTFIELDYVMGSNDYFPYFVILKLPSGNGDYLTYKLSCTEVNEI